MSDPMGGQGGNWIPLMDYAMKKGVSLSTLRRYIKADKIRYRVENGRYLVLESAAHPSSTTHQPRRDSVGQASTIELQAVLQKMSRELQGAREEIAELKTLVAFYESKLI